MEFNLITTFDVWNGERIAVRVTTQRAKLQHVGMGKDPIQLEAGYVLWWSDCVANDYEEFYIDLSVCLARLACLVACGESEFEKGFNNDARSFVDVARYFFAGAIQ